MLPEGFAMKELERKIKETMPLEDLPGYLRHLADALERKNEMLPGALSELPIPLKKLVMEGKAKDGDWKLKIKLKGEPPPAPQAEAVADKQPAEAGEPSADPPDIKYKTLKKRMKTSFKSIGEAIADRRFPEPATLDTFLSDSELMVGFAGARYGDVHYPEYREACRRLAEAFASKNWDAFQAGYTHLDRLKKDCHKAFK
jgi:XXXCH domain-containing protein